jgi:hypothetical protein
MLRMDRAAREAVKHAATPWEWRNRSAVVGLVAVCVVVLVAVIAVSWIQLDGTNRFVALLFYGALGSALLVRPARRSLRRWDERHRPSSPGA